MRLIPGTRLELVRCTGCGWEQILSGLSCSRCRHRVVELFGEPEPADAFAGVVVWGGFVSPYKIVFDRFRGVWAVYKTGPFARYIATFPTLLEAENYVTGRDCPDEVEPA